MKKLIFLATITICFCSCRVAEPVSMEDINGSIIETRATDGKTEHYYWCDGVKIPLTVNNDKMFVILETSRFGQGIYSFRRGKFVTLLSKVGKR